MNTASDQDPFDLQRFVDAQARDYPQALSELRAGKKRTHWIWYVLPQLRGLGASAMSTRYGIGSLAEAQAYGAHPVLGLRLRECVDALNAWAGRASAESILGEVDAAKFRSCLTLFAEASPQDPLFADALARHFGSERDRQTLALLE